MLIRELNINIGKVVELYRELSVRCGGRATFGAVPLTVSLRAALSARLVTRRNDEHVRAFNILLSLARRWRLSAAVHALE